ncbi:MAG TPA: 3-oxoadipate enol-lactonase [Ktedonobacterales bacterium]|jgi:3-oxoadipate enol-lactonase|nr:3-oxoadipate enol-lactonase [Ktedonobacterales bacterium]
MPIIDLPAGRCFYRFDGLEDAPVLMLSSSLGTDHRMWEPQTPALMRRYRVLRYDTRGHGGTDAPAGPYAMAELGCDARDLLDALGVARASFCGLSMGGMVGMWLAANAPDRVDRLMLCNTAALLGPPQRWDARIAAIRAGGMAAIASGVVAGWFTADYSAREPDVIAQMRETLTNTPAEGYIACCEAVRDMDQRALLARIQAPTLVIAGAHDAATPPADGRALADAIAGARYVELVAAHLSNIEAADAFTDAIIRFLTGANDHDGSPERA